LLCSVNCVHCQQSSLFLRQINRVWINGNNYWLGFKQCLQGKKNNTAVLLLGGNLGNTKDIFVKCLSQIENSIGAVDGLSALYESEPWGFNHDQFFLNQVVHCQTALSAEETLATCMNIESQLGRVRSEAKGYTARIIDIDILFYNDEIIRTPFLEVPHPRLHLRKFTLLPLQEILPRFLHPAKGKTIEELLNVCEDNSEVVRL